MPDFRAIALYDTIFGRSRSRFSLVGLVAGTALYLLPGQLTAQVANTPVAVLGSAAPAGGNYSLFPYTPVISTSGQVGFDAYLTGSSGEGIFAGPPGSLQTVALSGSPAPAGGTYNGLGSPGINASGQVVFSPGLTGGSSSGGIFVGSPGSIQAAALQGAAAPAGGTYSGFLQPVPNASGQVAFYADLTGGSSGIFAGSQGSMQAVARQGSPAPGGGTYFGFFNSSSLVVNASGQVAFDAWVNTSTTQGIFMGTPGSVQAVAISGNAAPAGGNYDQLFRPAINATGQVAFFSTLTGGSSNGGIFVGVPGALQTAALRGAASPAGGIYFSLGEPVINHFGKVSFWANMTGGSSTSGIFVGAPGAINAVVLQGQLAPAGNGATFSDFNPAPPGGLNALGQVVFSGTLTGTGVTSANNQGLYVASPGGGVVKVVRTGDMIDVGNGSGLHTVSGFSFNISGGEDGRPNSLSDTGVLVYSLTFTDGTQGVFTSFIPVPEPSSALFFVAGLLVANRFRKR
jgi:hypothetical protein